MPTANFYVGPGDNWVQVATAPKFARVSGFPHTHPYYLAAGSSAPSLTGTVATGTVTFSTSVPSDGNTVTVGTETYTFRSAPTLPFDVQIGGTFTLTAQNFLTTVNLVSTLVNASGAAAAITLTSKLVGTIGNYALSKVGANIAVSGVAMTGGANVTEGVLMCHHPFKVNVTMTENIYVRVPVDCANANNNDGKLRIDVFTIV